MQLFFVEMTDTFSGDANYSWCRRYKIKASTIRGAMRKLGQETGLRWKTVQNYADFARWDSKSGATCAFIYDFDDVEHVNYRTTEL